MAPNVQPSWKRFAQQYNRFHHEDDDDEEQLRVDDNNDHATSSNKLPSLQTQDPVARRLWQERILSSSPSSNHHDARNDNLSLCSDSESETTESDADPTIVVDALNSIRILDDSSYCKKNRDWLESFNAILSDVSTKLLRGLRHHAPTHFNARVADFNDNLYYEMQQTRGLDHYDLNDPAGLERFETTVLQANEYLGSFLSTEASLPQPPHVDYTYEVLREHERDNTLRLGFFPLTQDGMFLQVWPTATRLDDSNNNNANSQQRQQEVEGQMIFIPLGKILIIPASTIHGGGFRTSSLEQAGCYGNLRFHVYVATEDALLPAHQKNKYTEPGDKTRELSRRYVDARHMPTLLEYLFV